MFILPTKKFAVLTTPVYAFQVLDSLGVPVTGLTTADFTFNFLKFTYLIPITLTPVLTEIGGGFYNFIFPGVLGTAGDYYLSIVGLAVPLLQYTWFQPIEVYDPAVIDPYPINMFGRLFNQNVTQNLIIFLVSPIGAPLISVPFGSVNVDVVRPTGISPVAMSASVWSELGLGFYLLTLDGASFFNELGDLMAVVVAIGAKVFGVSGTVVAYVEGASIFYDVIRDSYGNPIPGALVEVFESGTATKLMEVRTSTLGQFSIELSEIAPITLVDLRISPIGEPTFIREGVLLA